MTELDKLRFNVMSELDVFISVLQQEGAITNKDVRAFVRDIVIPRLTILRVMVNKGT